MNTNHPKADPMQGLAAGPADTGSTPGEWFVRKLERNGVTSDCFVAAPDCQGFAYDAEILGDDEYRDGIDRKLADCNLIVNAVRAYRAAPSTAGSEGAGNYTHADVLEAHSKGYKLGMMQQDRSTPAPEGQGVAAQPAAGAAEDAQIESMVTKAWDRFNLAMMDGKDSPHPGMIKAFEDHYGQKWADRAWRKEASVWAAAWKKSHAAALAASQPREG